MQLMLFKYLDACILKGGLTSKSSVVASFQKKIFALYLCSESNKWAVVKRKISLRNYLVRTTSYFNERRLEDGLQIYRDCSSSHFLQLAKRLFCTHYKHCNFWFKEFIPVKNETQNIYDKNMSTVMGER